MRPRRARPGLPQIPRTPPHPAPPGDPCEHTRHAQSRAAVEQEIHELSLEKFRWKTAGDVDRLAELFGDDLVFVHLTGHLTTKGEWIHQLRTRRFVYDRIDLQDASVRAYGDTAVLAGKATFVVNGGSVYPLVYTEVYTEVYTRKNLAWQLVNLHITSDTF